MKKSLNKTEYKIIDALYNERPSNLKKGWTLTKSRDGNFLSIQNRTMLNQALGLAEKFPNIFEAKLSSFSLCIFKIKDLALIPELLNYNTKYLFKE